MYREPELLVSIRFTMLVIFSLELYFELFTA
jgi:hypothetical protein